MYSEDDLTSAVEAGVLPPEMAQALRRHVAARGHTTLADEEPVRLVASFNDIFVVIACVLLLLALAWIGVAIGPHVAPLACAVCAWGLAEFFTRQRRMALPSIALLLAFVGAVFIAILSLVQGAHGPWPAALAAAAAALAAWAHWRRFQVPITIAVGAASVAAALVATLLTVVPAAEQWVHAMSLAVGTAVFALAMRWDKADLRRQTHRADVAFWLHLLAAPLLVNPVFRTMGVMQGDTSVWQAIAVLCVYLVLAIVSLVIDRRALMVSGLGYVLFAFTTLLKQYGVVSLGFAITALIIGTALLLLSAFWHRSRASVLAHLPQHWFGRLTPLA